MHVLEILTNLNGTTSLNQKKSMLKAYDSPLLRKVLTYALDPFLTYGITMAGVVVPTEHRGTYGLAHDFMWTILDALSARKLTGGAALNQFSDVLLNLDPQDAEVAKRILDRDLQCGVGVTMTNHVFPKLIRTFNVMKAHSSVDYSIRYPAYGEVKYDGLRAAVIIKPKENFVEFYSRNGLVITSVPHLHAPILEMMKEYDADGEWVLDSELLTESFNDSLSQIKTKSRTSTDAKMRIFELLSLQEFQNGSTSYYTARRYELATLNITHPSITLSDARYLENEADMIAMRDEVWAAGGEGLIVKDPKGLYQPKKSKFWLKVKKRETIDLEVIDVFEGKGKYRNQLGGMVVKMGDVKVDIGGGFSDAQRNLWWIERDNVPGWVIEIDYHEVTPDGSLREPRFIRRREDKEAA